MKKTYSDIRSGIILFLVALMVYFVLIPTQIKVKASAGTLAADFFPRLTMIIVGGCGLLLAGINAYELCRNREKAAKERAEGRWKTNYKTFIPHTVFLATAIIYLLSMQYLGFVLSSIPFLIFLFWHFGQPKPIKSIVMASIYVPVVYLIFSMGLRVRFPIGPFGF